MSVAFLSRKQEMDGERRRSEFTTARPPDKGCLMTPRRCLKVRPAHGAARSWLAEGGSAAGFPGQRDVQNLAKDAAVLQGEAAKEKAGLSMLAEITSWFSTARESRS